MKTIFHIFRNGNPYVSLFFTADKWGADKGGYTSYFMQMNSNSMENLEAVNENIFTSNYGTAQNFYDNGRFID